MSLLLLGELLAAFHIEHPERRLSEVTVCEFAAWYAGRGK